MNTLFDYLSQGRPERVVQGALQFALINEPKLRRYVAEKLTVPVDESASATITLERKTVRGWRADVEIHWTKVNRKTLLELKLAAGLTQRQVESGRESLIHGMVVPAGGSRPGFETTVFTWKELATVVEHSILKQLFTEADTAASWAVETLGAMTANEEFSVCMKNGPGAVWPKLYWFLITIHQYLRENGKLDPYVTTRCAAGRQPGFGYFGYAFTTGALKREHWIGFSAMGGTLSFVLTDAKANSRIFAEPAFPLHAAQLAARIVQALGHQVVPERS